MIKISLVALQADDVREEMEHIYETAPKEAKESMEAGQVILDVTEMTSVATAVAVACLHGISGVMPIVLEDWSAEGYEDKETIDLHEIRQEFFVKYRSVSKEKKDGNKIK